ncbi:MAG: Hpt domain-containing protein [Deltaproteobacteria bacterium]|nr:Hpt domain-containing protein [Deltaproteobacteria bacterium]MBW2418200.1 Hpt domain-containing protein [Deltaproteobacteria bacterium]
MSKDDASRSVIDANAYAEVEAIADGQVEFMVELLGQYLSDGQLLVSSLSSATAAGDGQGLERPAHTLMSASANVGALRLADLCGELRMMGQRGALEGACRILALAEDEFELVKTELERRLDKLFGN